MLGFHVLPLIPGGLLETETCDYSELVFYYVLALCLFANMTNFMSVIHFCVA